MKCRGVALNGGFEGQSLALRENGNAMIANRTAENHSITRSCLIGRKMQSARHDTDSRSVDEQAVPMTFLDDLCITGDYLYPGFFGCALQRRYDPSKSIDLQSFFQNKSDREIERLHAAHSQIIDGAVHG